ncbi:IS607 family transposase [Candidatus Bathyarchaeota archaeon]|nr:IS607 family transposase [Candidatus Bathyarchaeota archaeon]
MERLYTMKEASKLLGVHIRTIQKWDKAGKIRCVRTIGGKRRVPESEIKRILGIHEERKIIGYARVSSHTKKDDLERQIELIKSYAKERSWEVEVLKDIGSGLNESRRNFQKLLRMVMNREVSKVIVSYPDRLTRFGFKILEEFFKSYGTQIVIINCEEKSPREELVEDLITIVSHLAGKLYGMRSHKYRMVVEGARKLIQDP